MSNKTLTPEEIIATALFKLGIYTEKKTITRRYVTDYVGSVFTCLGLKKRTEVYPKWAKIRTGMINEGFIDAYTRYNMQIVLDKLHELWVESTIERTAPIEDNRLHVNTRTYYITAPVF